ncbi:hypothetical protein J1N35_026433, partial [Gossypium stocksii]
EITKANRWERKFPEAQDQKKALEKSLLEAQNDKRELKTRLAELEKVLHQYRNRNSAVELRANLSKIEEMKGRIDELESTLRNFEL